MLKTLIKSLLCLSFCTGLFAEEISFLSDKVDNNNAAEEKDYEILSIFVNSRITKEVLEQFPKLQLITTRSTGYDHIDLDACKERGIVVTNVPGYGANTVAEFAFGEGNNGV